MNITIALLLIGLSAGVLSGAIGIGGGIVLVPALVLLLGYSQKTAQGTTLMMLLLPVVALGVWNYYQNGYVEIKTALILGIGFFIGGYLGSKIATAMPDVLTFPGDLVIHQPMKKFFAIVMILIAIKMLYD